MKYMGGCHCGAVKYEVEADINSLLSCNCSICAKKGALLAFAPAGAFKLIQGKEALSDYQFGKKNIHHFFCKQCGISSFGRGMSPEGKETVAINARCLNDVDTQQFPVQHFDGKSL